MTEPNAPQITRLNTTAGDFFARLDALLAFESATDERIERSVAEIIAAVRARGDAAVLEYTQRFDHLAAGDSAASPR